MNFMEVSAKDGSNINELFNSLGESIYEQIKTTEKKDDNRLSLTKENHDNNAGNGCKCWDRINIIFVNEDWYYTSLKLIKSLHIIPS